MRSVTLDKNTGTLANSVTRTLNRAPASEIETLVSRTQNTAAGRARVVLAHSYAKTSQGQPGLLRHITRKVIAGVS